jgi:NAD+ synthase (glutamine-hydrolysing)
MLIGIAQINPSVGDIDKNTSLILEYLKKGKTKYNLDTIIFPELMLTGYPPEDLLYRPAFHKKINNALDIIVKNSKDINLILGYPRKSKDLLYNSCAFICNERLITSYDKMELPNYGVFDEARYFTPGTKACVVNLCEIKTGLTICEDIWSATPSAMALKNGAELIININASPFHVNKHSDRKKVLHQRNKETGLAIIYANITGGQDELVFDGGSMLIDANGELAMEAPLFEEGLFIVDLIKNKQSKLITTSAYPLEKNNTDEKIIYQALVMAVRDYVNKNGFNGVVIGLSGGIDSALVTCIAVEALGNKNVEVILMPSRYTAKISNEDSIILAKNLNIKHQIISIEKPFKSFLDLLDSNFNNTTVDTTEENIQARCRGIILMALSNKTRRLVLATGNKSEMAVGYATLYGDMVGGFAPLKDVSKLLVYRLARWINRETEIIPERIISRPPTAELKDNQRDEDSLPPYDVLDPILERYIELDQSPQQIIESGFDREDINRVTSLVDHSEYKRRQAAPGVKISKKAFGRERRYPITSGYSED